MSVMLVFSPHAGFPSVAVRPRCSASWPVGQKARYVVRCVVVSRSGMCKARISGFTLRDVLPAVVVAAQRLFPMVQDLRTIEIQRLLLNTVIDVPVVQVVQDIPFVTQRPIPMVLVTIEIPQLLVDRGGQCPCNAGPAGSSNIPVVKQMLIPVVLTFSRPWRFRSCRSLPGGRCPG